ncbi:MarR family winged helix-turn-helix transcriptional regulator [Mammaliicoccus lentus]|uniref:MarR family winged helix-turn-helix transcriptional regulator n=1 Tax=Mammaliicoccus lentus TaxID=42858 RepID=UPI00374F6337
MQYKITRVKLVRQQSILIIKIKGGALLKENNKDEITNSDEELVSLVRGLGTRIVLYQQRVSELLKVYSHDFTSIDLLRETGPITAGELANKVGLTTGSVTSLVDRLEKVGYVRRERHPEDRRKVIIVPQYEQKVEVQEVFSDLNKNLLGLSSNYNEQELETIKSFLGGFTELLETQIQNSKEEKEVKK